MHFATSFRYWKKNLAGATIRLYEILLLGQPLFTLLITRAGFNHILENRMHAISRIVKAKIPEHLFAFRQAKVEVSTSLLLLDTGHVFSPYLNDRSFMSGELLSSIQRLLKDKNTFFFEGDVFCLSRQRYFYHFITEEVPRIVRLKSTLLSEFLVLTCPDQPIYVFEFLKLSKVNYKITTHKVVNLEKCLVLQEFESINSRMVDEIRTAMGLQSVIPDLELFVSRKHSNRYNPTLESKILAFFPEATVVHAENMSLQDQITLFSRAKRIIGCHGSNLTNMIWSKPGVEVFEIFDGPYRDGNLRNLAEACSHRYRDISELFSQDL